MYANFELIDTYLGQHPTLPATYGPPGSHHPAMMPDGPGPYYYSHPVTGQMVPVIGNRIGAGGPMETPPRVRARTTLHRRPGTRPPNPGSAGDVEAAVNPFDDSAGPPSKRLATGPFSPSLAATPPARFPREPPGVYGNRKFGCNHFCFTNLLF